MVGETLNSWFDGLFGKETSQWGGFGFVKKDEMALNLDAVSLPLRLILPHFFTPMFCSRKWSCCIRQTLQLIYSKSFFKHTTSFKNPGLQHLFLCTLCVQEGVWVSSSQTDSTAFLSRLSVKRPVFAFLLWNKCLYLLICFPLKWHLWCKSVLLYLCGDYTKHPVTCFGVNYVVNCEALFVSKLRSLWLQQIWWENCEYLFAFA